MHTIEAAVKDDARELAELGARTFHETFAPHTPAVDMAIFLRETYAPEIQARELADPSLCVLVARAGDGRIAGFIYLAAGRPPACVTTPAPVLELKRLYVDASAIGTGLGARLMRAGIDRAYAEECRSMWLGVWERNERAKRFYARFGFAAVGSHVFNVGNDPQVDLIYSMSLSPRPAPEGRPS